MDKLNSYWSKLSKEEIENMTEEGYDYASSLLEEPKTEDEAIMVQKMRKDFAYLKEITSKTNKLKASIEKEKANGDYHRQRVIRMAAGDSRAEALVKRMDAEQAARSLYQSDLEPREEQRVRLLLPLAFERRRMVLDKTYIKMTGDCSWYNSDMIFDGGMGHGNLSTDIEAISEAGGTNNHRAAFLHIYGFQHEEAVNGKFSNWRVLRLFLRLCDIRGSVQLQIPLIPEKCHEEMESIRQSCDEIIAAWDGSSTEYWKTPEIQARVDEIFERKRKARSTWN